VVIRFESKKDLTFPIVWGLIFFIYTAVGVGIVYTNNDYSALYSLACVWLGIGFLFVILLKTTYYTINDEHLVCHIFGFKKKVLINEIKKIEPQKGLYAGVKINTAWKGLIIYYGKWNEILISPAQEQQFIETIKARNPSLEA